MTSHWVVETLVTGHHPAGSLPQPSRNIGASLVALLCCCVALSISLIGIGQFDLPAVRYVRSVTIHLPWDQLTVPWMAFTSNAGNWIGEGWHLAEFSIVLLALAWAFKIPTLTVAAIQTLLAHGLVAAVGNALKHLIGRPRPKFVHSGDWQISPSLISGLDSFPSGHSMASFAVATVLAKRFPSVGPICLGVAAFVALSRILRGSHFPTDVVGGAVLGTVCGFIASAPLKQWRVSLLDGLRYAAIGASALLALLWALSRHRDDGVMGALFLALAVVAIIGGLWLRRSYWFDTGKSIHGGQAKASVLLIAYGLAAMTTSPLVLASVGFVCLAAWFAPVASSGELRQGSSGWSIARESVMLGSLVLALLILVNARGVLPFR